MRINMPPNTDLGQTTEILAIVIKEIKISYFSKFYV